MSPQDVGRGTGLVARGGAGGSHSRLLAVGPLSEPREGVLPRAPRRVTEGSSVGVGVTPRRRPCPGPLGAKAFCLPSEWGRRCQRLGGPHRLGDPRGLVTGLRLSGTQCTE